MNPYYSFWLPLWAYLHQPLFVPGMVWSPSQFWHRYQLKLLERCWEISYQQGRPRT